ncbi:glycosyltransferase family 4 protein [Desulfogranum marinum]|uniref:glycosyltransferase family 4 protein n=1 Tax=Desulfogranum marinum TaxID=453220 RepID=UPI001964A12D|nr:glycosyltransferase family 4 protein [Desulfogranum marinum]MBM9513974.1 glycosyltransferase family 4 protein [Desulfogranum marinum]
MPECRDIILCQDFFPAVGGAHHWLYEVYKRWPEHVVALVADYSSQFTFAERQIAFDQLDHWSLSIVRHSHLIDDLDLFSLQFYIKTRQVHKLICQLSIQRNVTLHCLRAYPEGFVAALYKRLHGNKTRLVTYAHGEEVVTARTSRQLTWAAKFAYKSSNCIIANSLSTQNLINDFCGHPNINIIHPGVDIDSFVYEDVDVQAQRQQWGVSEDDIVLVSISRMEPRKNHARVLKSVAELRSLGLQVVSVMASDGGEKPKLQQQAHDLGIAEFVRFPGYINDRERVLSFAAADIHVQPSIQSGSMIEGYGIVFIEAAAAGIPSIAGNSGGQAEAVLDGKTGFVIDGTDQKQLTEAIKRFAESSELRKQMGLAGRTWARKNDWNHIAEQTELLLVHI